ncbi:MAG: pyruvate kinase, partial [Candidatus Margulisbacteria bacterium]|nr:pyruvate kinase [Candidatus Margulisiibacteriota bacterium]
MGKPLNKKQILCTLGPASLNEKIIVRLADLGVDLFRLNLSHTKIDDLEATIALIQNLTDKPLCLDSEGAQIRCGDMMGGKVLFKENTTVKIWRTKRVGDESNIYFSPAVAFSSIPVGSLVSIDFDSVLLQIVDR